MISSGLRGIRYILKKRIVILLSLGLTVCCTVQNTAIKTRNLRSVQAAEESELNIIAEISEDDPEYSDPDAEILPEETAGDVQIINDVDILLSPEESGDADAPSVSESYMELYIDNEILSVPTERIYSISKDEYIFPEAYGDLYLIRFHSDDDAKYSLFFSQKIETEDFQVYCYDADRNLAEKIIDPEKINVEPDDSFLVPMDHETDYIIVVKHAEKYQESGFGISRTETGSGENEETDTETDIETESLNKTVVMEPETEPESAEESETESETESGSEEGREAKPEEESETVAESESEPEPKEESWAEAAYGTEEERETETESEPESESETETESETEAESETEIESVTETAIRLESVDLLLDDGLDQIPVPLLSCIDGQDTAKALLHYSDGTEQILTGGSDGFGNSCYLTYEDTDGADGSVSRTYKLQVIPDRSEDGMVPERSETIVFRQQAAKSIEDIKADDRTAVRFYGKKNWLLVKSVPEVTGKYSLQSFGRDVEEMFFLSEESMNAVKAEQVFELKKGVTYTFLLILEEETGADKNVTQTD